MSTFHYTYAWRKILTKCKKHRSPVDGGGESCYNIKLRVVFNFKKEGLETAKYNTVQKEELLEFLAQHRTEAFTVRQICELMKADGGLKKAPGESTLYRLIKELVESGTVKRTVKGSSRQFVYQLTDGESCHHHLHMKCVSCGKLFHMDDEESRELVERILKSDSFEIDSSAVLPGKCGECR